MDGLARRGSCWRSRCLATLAAVACPTLVSPGTAYGDPPANKVFGYEASSFSPRILEYDITDAGTVVFRRSCIPNTGTANGRGLALDERQGVEEPDGGGMNTETRVLYNTFLIQAVGDGLIHRNRLPIHGCEPLPPIPFGEGLGPPNQDDIGALDFHDVDDFSRGKGQDADLLYAAGYRATTPSGYGPGTVQILYKVNAETGAILGRCQAPQRTIGFGIGGNDTISFARIDADGDGRTEEVLLTDFGEFRGLLAPDSLAAVLESSLAGEPAPAPAPPCVIVAEFPLPYTNAPFGAGSGIDYEPVPKRDAVESTRRLVVTGVLSASQYFDADGPPFTAARPMGSTAPTIQTEDITVARVNPPEEESPPPVPATTNEDMAALLPKE